MTIKDVTREDVFDMAVWNFDILENINEEIAQQITADYLGLGFNGGNR